MFVAYWLRRENYLLELPINEFLNVIIPSSSNIFEKSIHGGDDFETLW